MEIIKKFTLRFAKSVMYYFISELQKEEGKKEKKKPTLTQELMHFFCGRDRVTKQPPHYGTSGH